MITDLKPHSATKDSGVPWLGEVPEHWVVRRLRNVADMRVSNVDKHTRDDELTVRLCNYIDVYKHNRIRLHIPFMRATASADEIERFRLKTGDVLITKDSEVWTDIGVPALVEETADDLICGYHLALLRPLRDRLRGEYLFRALQSTAVAYQFHVEANGVTRYGLSHAAIKSIWLPLPPFPEQGAIVRFLDHVDRRIRRYMRAKQKLIKLLEEQKQAIIHRAVSRSLDPNVRLKPSGVEWLGDVPEHWEVVALKRVCSLFRDGTHLPPPRVSTGVPLLSVRNIIEDEFKRRDDDSMISEPDYDQLCRSFVPRTNDVLLAIVGATLGKVAVIPPMERFHIQRSLAIFRAKPEKLSHKFLAAYLRAPAFQRALWTTVAFSAQPGIYLGTLSNFAVLLPPVEEQDRIVAKLAEALRGLDSSIRMTRKEIDYLREYRTRLIADVVTGKVDVREAAARLPEEIEDSETVDEIDERPEGEEENGAEGSEGDAEEVVDAS
jgi:type I restriction enzyme S subunit